jgi:hypothetical protein
MLEDIRKRFVVLHLIGHALLLALIAKLAKRFIVPKRLF